ncbi:hypothetical protein TcBrA4_0004110 [Trypanosoma cruzi]|nr:hypothetical protein TcBrA4_0004110 [Trypanosoma cruzi]
MKDITCRRCDGDAATDDFLLRVSQPWKRLLSIIKAQRDGRSRRSIDSLHGSTFFFPPDAQEVTFIRRHDASCRPMWEKLSWGGEKLGIVMRAQWK